MQESRAALDPMGSGAEFQEFLQIFGHDLARVFIYSCYVETNLTHSNSIGR